MKKTELSAVPTHPEKVQEPATYDPPAVVYEAALEVRAGTVTSGLPDPLDLFSPKEE